MQKPDLVGENVKNPDHPPNLEYGVGSGGG